MTVKVDRSILLKITFYVTTILTFMFDIDPAEGLRWVKTPSDITICPDETLNLTWKYEKEENEDILQFQWRFNSSTIIAYRGLVNGLHIEPDYHGRVNESGVTGILLKNITAKDKGSYSLHIIIGWKETPVIHSMWLNVIDAEAVPIPQWCTCERLPIFQEWNVGRNINVVTDGCRLEVNSSHCCIREPVNRCTHKNPQDLCHPFPEPITQIKNVTPVRNTKQLTENDTQTGLVSEGSKYKDIELNTTNTVLLILLIVIGLGILVVFFLKFIIWCSWRKRQIHTKEYQKANIKLAGITEQDEEQRIPMLTAAMILKDAQDKLRVLQERITSEPQHNMSIRTVVVDVHSDYNNDLKVQPCLGNQGIRKNVETLSRLDSEPRLSAFADYNDLPVEKARNNRDHVVSRNRRNVVGANEKWRNNQNNQNISLNASYDSPDFNNKGDVQLTNVELQCDDRPRSPKPIQIIDNTRV